MAKRNKSVKRYIALRGLTFPSPDTNHIKLEAGGLSKLTQKEFNKIVFERVEIGEECTNVPKEDIPSLLASNKIRPKKVGE